jgi:hypothetical protein
MKTRSSGSSSTPAPHVAHPDPREVDQLYGLEPVFEPGADAGGALSEFVQLHCPWCGEVFHSAVDLTTADRTWVEDCQICCRPMRVTVDLDEKGAISEVSAQRDD